jgi:quercetin dioxygenase-like cupin family protein
VRKLCRDQDFAWRDVEELDKMDKYRGVSKTMGAAGTTFRRISEGDGFWVTDSRLPPDKVLPLHSHNETEFSYILEGSCTLDDGTALRAGDGFVMTANEVYGLTAGPDGLRFLAVRPGEAEIIQS